MRVLPRLATPALVVHVVVGTIVAVAVAGVGESPSADASGWRSATIVIAGIALLFTATTLLAEVSARRLIREQEQLGTMLSREQENVQRLQELDRLKDTFLEAVSHDLRTPLTTIFGMALTLNEEERLTPEQRTTLLDRLVASAKSLQRLVADLLDLDRLSRGLIAPRRQSTPIGELAARAIENLGIDARTVDIAGADVVARVDPLMVERIVENLIANSVRHTPPGTRVWVKLNATPRGTLIAVEDAGPGVPDHLKESVFAPFKAGDRRALERGAGVGLSLVARFAELHGGRAWVQDRVGGGASFRVFLPAATDERAAA